MCASLSVAVCLYRHLYMPCARAALANPLASVHANPLISVHAICTCQPSDICTCHVRELLADPLTFVLEQIMDCLAPTAGTWADTETTSGTSMLFRLTSAPLTHWTLSAWATHRREMPIPRQALASPATSQQPWLSTSTLSVATPGVELVRPPLLSVPTKLPHGAEALIPDSSCGRGQAPTLRGPPSL